MCEMTADRLNSRGKLAAAHVSCDALASISVNIRKFEHRGSVM